MRKKRGFTLLEVLLTTIIISVGVTALVWAFSSGLFATTDIENMDLALNLAQEKMEDIKNTSYASISDVTKAMVSGFSAFQREVAVTTPQTNLKQVNVTVYWQTKGGEKSITLTTFVTKPCVLGPTKCS